VKSLRHWVNFGLLFSFITLATTGVMAFTLPFSIDTTRIHIVFGLATMLLVALHLATKWNYFKNAIGSKKRSPISRVHLMAIVLIWGILLSASLYNWQPVPLLVEQSYESRHRTEIVRMSPVIGISDLDDIPKLVERQPTETDAQHVSMILRFHPQRSSPPAVAIWAESTTGSMIETLYLDPRLSYSETPNWGGQPTSRNLILPIWRHRYTLITGIDPDGKIDAFTQATPEHTFSLESYLNIGDQKRFILCAEVNLPGDPNDAYPDAHVGQPSLLYTALVSVDRDQPYVLLELTGHGAGAESSGNVQYDVDEITTAAQIVDLLLARVGKGPVNNE